MKRKGSSIVFLAEASGGLPWPRMNELPYLEYEPQITEAANG